MDGADALIRTLVANDVTTCFANPGTSEMHFVAALDRNPEMRSVLCLFEGVATGAADGYARMADRPACTLLHLGPGYSNGAANLHNARRAYTPIVNIIGDHATYHRQYDAPLASDIAALARPNSIWVESARSPDEVPGLVARAVAASLTPPCGSASLILPADCAWNPTDASPVIAQPPVRRAPSMDTAERAARAIRAARRPLVVIGGQACRSEGLAQAARLQAAGIEVFSDMAPARQARGAGSFAPRRIQYFAELAMADLEGADLMVLVGTSAPVAFFAYPGRPSLLVPEGARTLSLADRTEDAIQGLASLADALDAPTSGPALPLKRPESRPSGALTPQLVGLSIARLLPEHAIICDEGVTSGGGVSQATATAAPHEVLHLTGGAIGDGLPMAVGAAVAAPERRVVALCGDGSAMYTVQALWTAARENLDITAVVFANHSYRILNIELARTEAGEAGPRAARLLDLTDPRISWVDLAKGCGVPAVRCETAEAFDRAFEASISQPGPMLIEAAIP